MEKIFGSGVGIPHNATLRPTGERSWHFDSQPFSSLSSTRDAARGDARLRKLLKRAVNNTYAPESLVDSIRRSIRV